MTKLEFNNKQEWLAARRDFITGTDAAKILGVSKFGDAYSVYLDKIGEAEPKPPTRKMIAGLRYQTAILDDYAAEKGHEIEHVPDNSLWTLDRQHLAASLDALDLTDNGLPVDAKNVGELSPQRGWGKPSTDQIPDDYRFQLAAQMAVTGAKLARLAVLVGGVDLVIYEQPHNAELEGMMLEAAAKFWRDHIIPRKPPKLGTSEESRAAYTKLFPVAKPYAIEGTDEDEVWLRYLRAAEIDYDDAKHRKEEAQAWFKQKMADAEAFYGRGGGVITWKNDRPSEKVDYQKALELMALRFGLKEVPDDIIKGATVIKPGARRFLTKWPKVK